MGCTGERGAGAQWVAEDRGGSCSIPFHAWGEGRILCAGGGRGSVRDRRPDALACQTSGR